ncbi:MAG: DNA gyrase inhibitor YacG [Acidocella sp.]|jgi:endogenous inhibitor of DNA gyrase (YacG/DUF329 family)|nr:DNA gyrase inhibitor YacG [Acidocella sp.]
MSQCPVCKKPANPEFKPFCSQRCADVDLGRWLTESYSLPAKPAIEEEEEAE